MDNGYSKIETVEQVFAVLESDIERLRKEAFINHNNAFYLEEDFCHRMANHLENRLNNLKKRAGQ